MKKMIILLIAAFIVTGLSAQNNKRTSAFNYFKNGKLDKAKEYIDPTITHPKTMNVAKTWYYRGNIYLQIARSDNPEYKALDQNALWVAYESYKRCAELDSRGEFKTDIHQNFRVIASNYFNQGVAAYNAEDYSKAAESFQNTFNVYQEIGVVDTLALSNVAMAYDIAEEYDQALEIYGQLIDIGYKNPMIYQSVSEIYLNRKNDTVAAEQYVIQGREIFPDDYQLLIAETNLFLAKGENKKAVDNLLEALETDTENKTIWFALGTNYENSGDPESAEDAYLKCIDIDPAYADAYYNMGAMYNNQAAEILEIACELPWEAIDEYNVEKAKADTLLQQALPYLEKSDELNPDNLGTLRTLKQIYTILNNMEKLQEVNARIKELIE
ncbi:MAG: tetratricopeptide repeat protein [Bacteroidetes bacterium]|nr:tetratricopeptide repeat protein [Bacteroidota bacterium]